MVMVDGVQGPRGHCLNSGQLDGFAKLLRLLAQGRCCHLKLPLLIITVVYLGFPCLRACVLLTITD
eukprot:1207416-Amphidinium_carterae.1